MHFTNDEGWVKANGKKDSTENRLHTVIILSNKTTTNTDKNPFFFRKFCSIFPVYLKRRRTRYSHYCG